MGGEYNRESVVARLIANTRRKKRYDNLVEVPFAKYDMINKQWQTEDDFVQYFSIDRITLIKTILEL